MISTHVLDTSHGSPAVGVPVKLQFNEGKAWKDIETGKTNGDGRFTFAGIDKSGLYQIIFEVDEYLRKHSKDSFYLSIPIQFKVGDPSAKCHVPLLLNPFGFSTYRGT